MDKPFYQPWDEEAFLSDPYVRSMSFIEKSMYRALLQEAWVNTTRPDLPDDPEILWRLAGCDSRQQWDEHCKPVLAMFSKDSVGGASVLYRRRLRKDWDNQLDKTESYSDRGRAGAASRWGNPPSPAEPSRVLQKQLNPLKLLPNKCRELLGIRAEREEWYKEDLKELAEAYGGTQVVDAFELWAKDYNKDTRYPIKEFIRVADSYLSNRVQRDDPGLDALCVSLYQLGGQVFAGKHRAELNKLIGQFSFVEIERAYKEFISNRDEFSMKFAPRDFVEGGAVAIITAQRLRKQQAEDIENKIAAQHNESKAAVELMRARVLQNEEEEEIGEDDLKKELGL